MSSAYLSCVVVFFLFVLFVPFFIEAPSTFYTYMSPFQFYDLDTFYGMGCYSDMSLPFFSIGSEKATSNHLVRQTKALHRDQIRVQDWFP